MCRLVAYHGPPLALSAVLADAPHGLIRQSYAPAEMTGGLLNADGWGVGWFAPGSGARPGVLKGVLPIWADENATAATHAIASGSILAIVRSATPGLGVAMANTPPYPLGDYLFAHNGRLWPWPVPLARAIRARVAPEDEAEVRGTTDSEWLAALWRTRLRRAPDRGAGEALRAALREVRDLAIQHQGGVSANLVLVGPTGFFAVRFAEPGPAPSLYLAQGHPRWPGGVMIASEPIDEADGWQAVPPSSFVQVDGRGVCVGPLGIPGEVSWRMPTPRRTLTIEQLRAHLKAHAFASGAADLVGVEVELTPLATFAGRVDLAAARAGVDGLWAGMPIAPGEAAPSWRGGTLSLEPGGQLEYSGHPVGTTEEAAHRTIRAVRGLRALARRRGCDFVAVGLHPWGSVESIGLRTPAPRYRAMQAHFDALGPHGRRMMRLTGSVQVNLDFGGPAELAERWELAQRLAPVLAATFANSAVEAGRPAPVPGLRGEIWLRLDPSRGGFPGRFLEAPDSDPVDQYLAFALSWGTFLARPDGPYEVPSPPITFGTWMAEGLPSGFPDLFDWRMHLSTLFPDVRAKGYLELRSMDAPGSAWLDVPVLLAGHALRDSTARRALLDHLRPLHEELPSLRERAARIGLADPTLKDSAEFLIRAVRPHLGEADGVLVDAYAERYVRRASTPGEELRGLIPEGGALDPAVLFDLERERAAAAGRRLTSTSAVG